MTEQYAQSNTREEDQEEKFKNAVNSLTSDKTFDLDDFKKGLFPEINDENVFIVLERVSRVTSQEAEDSEKKQGISNKATVGNIKPTKELLRILPNSMKENVNDLLKQDGDYQAEIGLPIIRKINDKIIVKRCYKIIDTVGIFLALLKNGK